MTEDYKKTLIEYMTGLLNQEQPTDKDFNIQGTTYIDYTSDSWQIVVEKFRLQSAAVNGILQNEKYDDFIMYGGYQEENGDNSKGFLIYVNKFGTPTKVVKLQTRGFLYLDYDEESNRIYGIVGDRATYQNSLSNEGYFVYYNNLFLVEESDIKQTYAYKIYNNNQAVDKIIKDPESSNYLIFTRSYPGIQIPIVYELKINVGQPNELTTWNINSGNNNYMLYGMYGWYDESNSHFILITKRTNNNQFVKVENNGSNLTYTNISIDTVVSEPQQSYIHPQWIAINQNNIYFIYLESWIENNISLRRAGLYYYDGTSIKVIYYTPIVQNPQESGTYPIKNVPMLNIINDVDNTLYLLEYESNEQENTTSIKICNLTKDTNLERWQDIGIYSYIYRTNIFNQRIILRRNFNIANIFTFSGYFKTMLGNPIGTTNGFQVNIQNLAPINGYIGEPYISVNSLVPKYANLYSFGELILLFSRNVFNVSKLNNTTTSSVEIPNNYLNDYNTTRNKLISETNLTMNSDSTSWNKNIYEVVDLNFINTIRVIDEDTGTDYIDSAIKVNDATTDGGDTNYQNTPCNKYRINYSDNTTAVNTLSWNSINKYNKKTLITFYADKLINSIDLISNDESVIYLHIPVEAEVGKYYTINQKVRIGDKPTAVQLQYNNEDINYQNQPVMVYVEE